MATRANALARLGWGSWRLRFVAGSILWCGIVLFLGGRALSTQFHDQADTAFAMERAEHFEELSRLVYADADGQLALRSQLSDPRFLIAQSGYYWEIEDKRGVKLRSPSLQGADIPFTIGFSADAPGASTQRPGPTGAAEIYQDAVALPSGGAVRIAVATDRRLLNPLVKQFDATTRRILGFVGVGLLVTMIGQAFVGFLPLSRLQREVQRIGSGEGKRLPEDFPTELQPTVASLNGLLDANEAIVERSQILAGNLAHSLKTPLSIIVDEATKMAAVDEGDPLVILRKCERIRAIVDFQLARIRAASGGRKSLARLPLAPAIQNVLSALSRLHPGLSLSAEGLTRDLRVACERQDFDEIFANLVDNALKWATTSVRVAVYRIEQRIEILVEDDGPGMSAQDRERVFEIGVRLDEAAPGSGFGLAIVKELAEAYHGRVSLETSELGGLRARLTLPAAV